MDPETQGVSAEESLGNIEALLGDDLDMLDEEDTPDAESTGTEAVDSDDSEVDDKAEDADDTEEGDDEESEEDDEEAEAESGITDETLVDIQIGDDIYEVNFAELRSGYLRQEEYASKVQAAEAEYNSKLSALENREAELAEELRLASVMVTGDLQKYNQINWVALKDQDPAKYQELRLAAMEANEKAQAVEARRQGIKQMHEQAQALRHKAYVAGQLELAEKLIPGFREPENLNALVAYGESIGWTKDDIYGIADARQLLTLHNAMLYSKSLVKKKEAMEKKVTKDLPPVVKPGAAKEKTSTDRRVVKNAQAAFKRDKSVESAAALLMTLDL